MTRIVIKKLVWDKFNVEHIGKHSVEVKEVEEVSRNIIIHERGNKGRYLVIGRTGTRIITLIVKRVSLGIYYPVTARDAAKKERQKVYSREAKAS